VPIYGPDVDIGAHFIIGLIDLKAKQITILDSLSMAKAKRDYGIAFLALLEVTNLIIYCGLMVYNLPDWKFVVSDDSAQQNDGINCGIFVILNIAAMFEGHQLSGIEEIDRARHWIYDLLIKYKKDDPKLPKIRSLPDFINLEIDKIEISAEPTSHYVSNIINVLKNSMPNVSYILFLKFN
jgi:hypothetical protein